LLINSALPWFPTGLLTRYQQIVNKLLTSKQAQAREEEIYQVAALVTIFYFSQEPLSVAILPRLR
jgi:hypothetical protein